MSEITPVDIQNKEFRRSLRGYHTGEMDEFLDRITKTLDGLLRENEALKEQVAEQGARVEQYRGIEDTLQHTLVIAQETADEVRANARKESQLMLAEARAEADRMRERSEEELRGTRRRAEVIRSGVIEYISRAVANTSAQLEVLRAAQRELEADSPVPDGRTDVDGESPGDDPEGGEW